MIKAAIRAIKNPSTTITVNFTISIITVNCIQKMLLIEHDNMTNLRHFILLK